MSIGQLLRLLSLARELGPIILDIAEALKGDDNAAAAELARSHGQASGRAAYNAARNAGKSGKAQR